MNKKTSKVASNSPTALFSVAEDTTFTDEFLYAYNKNNNLPDSISRSEDIKDYLDLYVRFKLKIAEARSRGMDTTAQFRREFDTYSAQLKKPYLTDKSQIDSLVKEAYERLNSEIRASHLLIRLDNNASPEDTLGAYNKIEALRSRVLKGEPFDKIVLNYSEDPSARQNKGDLGYFTAMQMVYPFENAAYQTSEGELSEIIRTQFGYHLLKVYDKRPANGQVEVSHIMIRPKGKSTEDSIAAKNKIFEIYDQLQGGVAWVDLVDQYSEDINSKKMGGRLRPFRVGQLPLPFQETAFSLQAPGEISDPVQTPYGWHIIRLEKRIPIQTFDEIRVTLESQVNRGERAEVSRKALVDRLKKENQFSPGELHGKLLNYNQSIDSLRSNQPTDSVLFKIGDEQYYLDKFIQSIPENPSVQLNELYRNWVEEKVIAYEEAHLEEKYFDYRMLLREYRQGILLFQLMEEEVWNKASEDSVGLQEFYTANISDYQYELRADALIITSDSEETLVNAKNEIPENASDSLLSQIENRINKDKPLAVSIKQGVFELSELKQLDSITVKPGEYKMNSGKKVNFIRIDKILPPEPKPLNEIKGLVIADYQTYLEEKWIEKLRSEYKVTINHDALNEIIDNN